MTIEDMKARKIELGLTNEMIADQAGIPLSTVQKIFSGVTKAPRKLTIEAIEKVLATTQQIQPSKEQNSTSGPKVYYGDLRPGRGHRVAEATVAYGSTKEEKIYTIDDYYALPKDLRVELIDGVFYDMGTPSLIHQKILGDLYLLFRQCADRHNIPCEVLLSPCDVRLDRDNYTLVQPDLLVICHDYDIRAIRYEGEPDLVVEILSPSTRSKDMILKLYKYQNAGVKEYWIVDPKHQTVTVHYFEEEDYHPRTYTFDSEIPVFMAGEDCSIDFSRIMKGIAGYYEG